MTARSRLRCKIPGDGGYITTEPIPGAGRSPLDKVSRSGARLLLQVLFPVRLCQFGRLFLFPLVQQRQQTTLLTGETGSGKLNPLRETKTRTGNAFCPFPCRRLSDQSEHSPARSEPAAGRESDPPDSQALFCNRRPPVGPLPQRGKGKIADSTALSISVPSWLPPKRGFGRTYKILVFCILPDAAATAKVRRDAYRIHPAPGNHPN